MCGRLCQQPKQIIFFLQLKKRQNEARFRYLREGQFVQALTKEAPDGSSAAREFSAYKQSCWNISIT